MSTEQYIHETKHFHIMTLHRSSVYPYVIIKKDDASFCYLKVKNRAIAILLCDYLQEIFDNTV